MTQVVSESLSCTIQGASVSILVNSFSASESLNNRPTCMFNVYYETTLPGNEGDEVIITRSSDNARVFAGRVVSVRYTTDESRNYKVASFTCGGYEVLADRRQVAELYINKTSAFIVNDLLTKYLSADGVTAGTIATGVTVDKATFAYEQLSSVLRQLAELNGFVWYIDYNKALHFVDRDASAAPWNIDGTSQGDRPVRGVNLDASLTQYRNRQYIKYNEITAERTESFAGDGQTQTFSVEFPLAQVPTVLVNGAAQTVGIGGLEDGKQWYWNKGSKEISQDLGDTALGGYDPLVKSRQELVNYEDIVTSFTLLTGLHVWGEYVVAAFSDTNGGYVLYKRNGINYEQINNLRVFTGRRANRIIGFGDYFLSLETYGVDSVDVCIYKIVSDTITLINTPVAAITAATAATAYYYRQANGKHVAVSDNTGLLTTSLRVDIVDTAGAITNATGTASGLSLTNRFFTGYHEAYCFVIDNNAGDFTGGTLRQLSITDSVYAIATDPTNLSGDFDGGYASTNGYAFFRTSAGIEVYNRADQSAATTKLSTITAPSGYTFATSATDGKFTQMSVYDDWLLVPVVESPYLLAYRIDRATNAIDYVGPYDSGITAAPRFLSSGAVGGFVGVYSDNEIVGVYTAAKPADILSVTYRGLFPNIAVVDDFAEQTSRQAAEGGTGIYEAFQSSDEIDGDTEALSVAQIILDRYGRIPRIFTFETLKTGLETGQTMSIVWTELGINETNMLIERIDTRDEGKTLLWYRVRAISGSDIGNWQEFWRSLQPEQRSVLGESDVLPLARSVSESVILEEEITVASAATETNWDEGNWNEMEWQ